MPHQAKRWILPTYDGGLIDGLCKAAGLPPVLAELLVARGVDSPEGVRRFLGETPDAPPTLNGLRPPTLLPGCDEVAGRLMRALGEKKRIVVYGDYDADGMTASAILFRALKFFGGRVDTYVPDRLEEGYGLNASALEFLAGKGVHTVVTVDCGINSCKEADRAAALGIELLITDHHTPGAVLPVAPVAHPQLIRFNGRWNSPHAEGAPPGESLDVCDRYPFTGLSGSMVAFKVAWKLGLLFSGSETAVPDAFRPLLRRLAALAAIGTVADVVPLIDENRVLVRFALHALLRDPSFPGVAALMDVAQVGRYADRPLSAEDIGFSLAPRLNAAGRLNQAPLAVELLTTDHPARAEELARQVQGFNETRQQRERSVLLDASKRAKEADPDSPALIFSSNDWDPGIIGIVAGKLAEKFHKPSILIATDTFGMKPGSGSCRSAGRIHLYETLAGCAAEGVLLRFGGHAAAAGFQIEPGKIEAFRDIFCRRVREQLGDQPFQPELRIDAECTLGALTPSFVSQIDRLAPFGHENPRPVLCATGVVLDAAPKTMGDGRHLNALFRQDNVVLRGFAFHAAEWIEELESLAASKTPIDIAFHAGFGRYGGKVELHLKDWRH